MSRTIKTESIRENQSQYLRALTEEESYSESLLIVAYSPCINNGTRSGEETMGQVMKIIVASGYRQPYRYSQPENVMEAVNE